MRNHDAQTAIVSALKSSHARNDDIALSAHQVAGVVLGVGYLTGISDEDINDIAPAAEREYLEWAYNGVPFDTFTEACYDTCSLAELEVAIEAETDTIDMDRWGLTADEWRQCVSDALIVKRLEAMGNEH